MHKSREDFDDSAPIHYRATVGDILTDADADTGWGSMVMDLTAAPETVVKITGAKRAGEVAVDGLLAELFPAPDTTSAPHSRAS